ncbi:MAG: response regulator [Candidatus Omnitrophota bacterium]
MYEKTILLVDDEKDFVELTSVMLEVRGGYKVVTAYDGKEAVKKANKFKPDLILMDISMPRMDGIEALKILKAHPKTLPIPVIMLTAHGEDFLREKACQLYDEDYITKPVEAAELMARIAKVLENRKI